MENYNLSDETIDILVNAISQNIIDYFNQHPEFNIVIDSHDEGKPIAADSAFEDSEDDATEDKGYTVRDVVGVTIGENGEAELLSKEE